MADPKKTTGAAEAKEPAPAYEPSTDLTSTFALEYEEDQKTMRWAVGIALVLHLIFLPIILILDFQSESVAPAEKPKVYVVQQVRFKPPPPKQQQEIPKPKAKKVPIPDPTPDEPEPIRLPDEIQPEVNLPETDVIFDIPEGPPPSPEPEGPIQVGGDVQAPVKVYNPQPQYTEIARKARLQGVVIVQAIIDKEGNVTNVKVLKGLGMGLDQAAVDAIKKWRFEPATLHGKPVAVYYNLTVNFRLQ
ncbi:MAG TPA: TonB family protein [Thermoanaerobaculia bacterium]|nr:TonB family protein [Thermoanaerobaculia bacterium]